MYALAAAREDARYVGEVVLALIVVRANHAQGRAQQLRVERHEARVDLRHLELVRRAVARLADVHEHLALVAQDAPVRARGAQLHAQHGGRGTGPMVAGEEIAQRLAAHQRHVADEHEHRALEPAQSLHGRLHRVRRPAPLGLERVLDAGHVRESALDVLAAVADDHDGACLEPTWRLSCAAGPPV